MKHGTDEIRPWNTPFDEHHKGILGSSRHIRSHKKYSHHAQESLRLIMISAESTSYSKTHRDVQGPIKQIHDQDEPIDGLIFTKENIERSYDLIWNQQDCGQAVVLLQEALKIQREYLGKYHNDIGWTCNFIGTGYWRMGEAKAALRYFIEARRIFCRSGHGKIKGIDRRIQCLLGINMNLSPDDVEKTQTALQSAIQHEIQGDRLKDEGRQDEANVEYSLARESSAIVAALL